MKTKYRLKDVSLVTVFEVNNGVNGLRMDMLYFWSHSHVFCSISCMASRETGVSKGFRNIFIRP